VKAEACNTIALSIVHGLAALTCT